ncbi:hypothetical protein EA462_00435 [Natrarchaeobius halalkaliphilus]|uniref:Uncharacterized protein n=1 Tax=Natrarchaeobius halalkaliphilus TaxID=1679091 RepID=A0A3N6P936_9EURY|nr:hypothetical protein [Natrarchaeobius halalkaliphilus]RQG92735.1 hypothetical protein EA462_00435 [Natrarchaeobius halalkaliphilus]
METRWATIDGVHIELPADCTVEQLRQAFRKPPSTVLVAVTGDLVSVVHDENRPLSEMVAGCADTYYFRSEDDQRRNEILAAPQIEDALVRPAGGETTFQRPGLDH